MSATILLFACGVLTFAGCAKSRGPETGTNTNWLHPCDETADCDGDGECLCGVCTRSCTREDSCADLGRRAACTSLASAQCGGGSDPGSVCLPAPSGANGRDGGPSSAGSGGVDGGAGLALTRNGPDVQIGARYRACGLDEDCILVETACDGCCKQDAIREHDRAAYDRNFAQVCSDWRGGMCDCQPPDLVPRCQEGRCVAVERALDADCFSPTQNLDRASRQPGSGCRCEQPGLGVCLAEASLICEPTVHGPVWQSITDGPCEVPVETCDARHLVAGADACLSQFTTCHELPTGMLFCGSGCRAPLDCDERDCQYARYDVAKCGGFPVYEGFCGDVRYRAIRGGLGPSTMYWDAAGQLLAIAESSDVPEYCMGGDNERIVGDLSVVANCKVVTEPPNDVCPTP